MPLHVRLKGQTSTASWLSAKRNWSGGGIAGGKKSNRREDAKGKGTKLAGGSKGEKREEHKGRGGNAGQRRRRSEAGAQADAKKYVSGADRRKRKGDHDSWYGDDNNASSSKSKLTRKNPSHVNHGKLSVRKGDRLKSLSSEEDDLRSGKRSSSKVYDLSRGAKGRPVLGKNAETSKGKRIDKPTKVNRQKDGATNADFDENVVERNKPDDSDHITEEKPRARRTRVLDKTGKKIRVTKKDSVPDPEEATPPKRRKRMKLDPYDTSNKRLDDSTPNQDGVNAILQFFKWFRLQRIHLHICIFCFILCFMCTTP